MFRIVIVALIVVAAWVLGVMAYRALTRQRIDWTGIATIIGFIVLAFYLRHVTGMG